jgi:hypothetical protein
MARQTISVFQFKVFTVPEALPYSHDVSDREVAEETFVTLHIETWITEHYLKELKTHFKHQLKLYTFSNLLPTKILLD